MLNLLVTGSTGFVGRSACYWLHERGFSITAMSRRTIDWPSGIRSIATPNLLKLTSASSVFKGINCVLHLSGRAHVMREVEADPLDAFRSSNVVETLHLAREASAAGVKRFVFVSSIKVNGDSTHVSTPFTEAHVANPLDPYAISKHEAEIGLSKIAVETGIELVIVRPPLIYGRNVKGNFRTLINLLSRKIPLPLGSIRKNRRSFLSLHNFVDFLSVCVVHPSASGRLFLVSDQEDVSTADLLFRLGAAMGKPACLLPVPTSLLKNAAYLTSQQVLYQRLCSSLVVDSTLATDLLGWSPPQTLDEGLRTFSPDLLV